MFCQQVTSNLYIYKGLESLAVQVPLTDKSYKRFQAEQSENSSILQMDFSSECYKTQTRWYNTVQINKLVDLDISVTKLKLMV